MDKLKVTLIQADLIWEEITGNLAMFEEIIWGIDNQTDLIILPEMFNTGFTQYPQKIAEHSNMTTFRWMKNIASQKQTVIVGSFVIKEKTDYYNRLIWMEPDGKWDYYDKRHLFSIAKENLHFKPGNRRIIKSINGWKIYPLICYDLRFPVWSRNTKTHDYDVLLYIANWPKSRIKAWESLLQARAIENLSYSIGLNRTGKDGNDIKYNGQSVIFSPNGKRVFKMGHKVETKTISLSKSILTTHRKSFPANLDSDQFIIIEE